MEPLSAPSVRLWNDEDYPTLVRWWTMHASVVLPQNILPKTGYILERDGIPTCAIFAYLTVDLGVAHLKWIISEPGKSLKQSRDDFKLLFDGMVAALRALSYNVYFVDCAKSLAREVEGIGFTECSRGNVFSIMQTEL